MAGALETIFEFLFKYPLTVFERGSFAFSTPSSGLLIALLVILAGFLSLFTIRWAGTFSRRRERIYLLVLRSAALLLLLFCALQPVLVVSIAVPQENFIGILIDDTLSMQLTDYGERPRSALIDDLFGPENSQLLAPLSERFKLRYFAFSSTTGRIRDLSELSFTGQKTHIGQALERARQELAAVPLSGLVVITDGADNNDASMTEPLLALRSRNIPIYTIGVGSPRFMKDIEIERIESPRSVLRGTTVSAELLVRQRGYGGSIVDLIVEESGRILKTQPIELPGEGQTAPIRVHFTVTEPGPHNYRFYIQERPDEQIDQNNVREVMVLVEDDREKILYLDGEPRYEFKFIRRAVADDENLHVVGVQRVAENKFIRFDLDNPDELMGGFPATREELFKYKGLILASIEADFFTSDQLQMIADFVSRRGGGLIMLGGRWSYSEGGFANTPVADVLPVILEEAADLDSEHDVVYLDVEPTPFGRAHAITQLEESEEATRQRWQSMPQLSTVNRVIETKPGATTLLEGKVVDGPGKRIVLAYQRYGRGKSFALPVQDTWMWQMDASIDVEDQTHEMFWRQLLRWLVSDVPDQVSVKTSPERIAPGEEVTLVATIDDESFLRVNNTEVTAFITDPLGETHTVPMDWTVEEDGEYRGYFNPDEEGRYEIRVSALEDGSLLGTTTSYMDVVNQTEEYFGAEMRQTLLERIAIETGGRFYTPDNVENLIEDIRYTESGTTVLEEKDLWDMPAIFLLLILLISTEWFYRRYRGLK